MDNLTKQAKSVGPVETMGFNVHDICHSVYWEHTNEPINYNKEVALL